ncbi:MAG: hypothetical protein JWN24_95 [Phycisphaerales bacterium]|nr:hypothetical protein [Phycisphaerales bacterium]
MNQYRALWAIALGGALVIGCNDKKDEKPAAPSTPTTPSTPAQPVPQSNSGAPVVPPTVPNTAAAPTLPAVPATAPATADAASADAQKLLLQAKDDMASKKWDAAEADLKKLEGMKDQLSTQLQVAVTSLRTQLDASKAASSIKIPGLGTEDKNK